MLPTKGSVAFFQAEWLDFPKKPKLKSMLQRRNWEQIFRMEGAILTPEQESNLEITQIDGYVEDPGAD